MVERSSLKVATEHKSWPESRLVGGAAGPAVAHCATLDASLDPTGIG